MKKSLSTLALILLTLAPLACSHVTTAPSSPSTATPTSTPVPTYPTYVIPTSTPGCYNANALPVTQYNLPNPLPTATPFWTPVAPLVPTSVGPYEIYHDPEGTVILRSLSDWNVYWADMGLPAQAPPTDFSAMMVLIPGYYYFQQVCYTGTNVVVYQDFASGGAPLCLSCVPPTSIGTVTPVPTLTPTPTPSTLPHGYYLIPASSLPISFVSSYLPIP